MRRRGYNFYGVVDALIIQFRMSRRSRCARESDTDNDKFHIVRIIMRTRQRSNMPLLEFNSEKGGATSDSRTGITFCSFCSFWCARLSRSFLRLSTNWWEPTPPMSACSPGLSSKRKRGCGWCANRAGNASIICTIGKYVWGDYAFATK